MDFSFGRSTTIPAQQQLASPRDAVDELLSCNRNVLASIAQVQVARRLAERDMKYEYVSTYS